MIIDREARRRAKRKRAMIIRSIVAAIVIVCIGIGGAIAGIYFSGKGMDLEPDDQVASNDGVNNLIDEPQTEALPDTEADTEPVDPADLADPGFVKVGDTQFKQGFTAKTTSATVDSTTSEIDSEFFILIDMSTLEIVAQRKGREKMYPASMTKILSLLVAAEHLQSADQLEEIVTVTRESTAYSYANGLSAVGFNNDEKVPLRDLFYGTILKSGGDAVHALALYTAGSHEAFVDMMNAKVAELGLAESSHFTNCAGVFDEENYSTAYDIAMILKAAEENPICQEVLKTRRYNIPKSDEHPDGIYLSNLFLRRIEDQYTEGEFLGAKTGFVNQSRNCCASYMLKNDGIPYICVTGKAPGAWPCIYDHVDIYTKYTKK